MIKAEWIRNKKEEIVFKLKVDLINCQVKGIEYLEGELIQRPNKIGDQRLTN